MAQIITRLHVLNQLGQGLLIQLHNLKQLINNTKRAPFLADPAFVRVNKLIVPKFPELPPLEKTGAEIYKDKAQEVINLFTPYYTALADVADFQATALTVLLETNAKVNFFMLELNAHVTEEFFDLIVVYIQLILLAQKMEEKKTLIMLHQLCYKLAYNQREVNLDKILKFFTAYDKPIRKIQEEFRPMSSKIVQALVPLLPSYMKVRNTTGLRNEAILSIIAKPQKLTAPISLKTLSDMAMTRKMYLWFVFGMLVSPEDLEYQGAMNLVKFVLSEGPNTALVRDESAFLYMNYEYMFDNYKSKTVKLGKLKPLFKEGTTAGFAEAALHHRERRIFYRQEIENLYNLLSDTPGLIGPKFQILVAVLSGAKEEIMWFVRHKDKIPGKRGKPEDFQDPRIVELIHYVVKFQLLLRDNTDIVKRYYLEFLGRTDLSRLREFQQEANFQQHGPELVGYVTELISFLSKVNPETDSGRDFEALRLLWCQVEVGLSPLAMKSIKLIEKINFIMQHTEYIDSTEQVISKACSLRELYYFKNDFVGLFEVALQAFPACAMTMMVLLSQFPENGTAWEPAETPRIGEEVVAMAESFFSKIVERAGAVFDQIANEYIVFDNLHAAQNGIHKLLETKEDYKPEKHQPPPIPGSESLFANKERYKNLRLYQKNLNLLCSACNEITNLVVYDTAFAPKEYLVEMVANLLRAFMKRVLPIPAARQLNPSKPENIIQPPSVLLKQINVYMSLLRGIENYVDINVTKITTSVMLEELYAPTGAKDVPNNSSKLVTQWYVEFLTNKINLPGVCYAPNRKGFVSRRGLPFRAEEYADLVELETLCALIGPYGVKNIDKEIIGLISKHISNIKECLKTNRTVLDEFNKMYHQEPKVVMLIKPLKPADPHGFDEFIAHSIAIGKLLLFRELLLQACGEVILNTTPLIHKSITTAFSSYPENLFKNAEFTPVDLLAVEAGIHPGLADPEVKDALVQDAQSDKKLWDLLPTMYALSFLVSSYWREAVFVPSIEAHDNNVHVLTKAINELIIHFKSLTSDHNSEEEIVALLNAFVEMSSVVLMRMARSKTDKTVKDLPSVVVFLDMFIKECPLLVRSEVEQYLPYPFVRSMWREVYSVRKRFGEEQEAVF